MGLLQTFPVQTKRIVFFAFPEPLSLWDDILHRIVTGYLKSMRLGGGKA